MPDGTLPIVTYYPQGNSLEIIEIYLEKATKEYGPRGDVKYKGKG